MIPNFYLSSKNSLLRALCNIFAGECLETYLGHLARISDWTVGDRRHDIGLAQHVAGGGVGYNARLQRHVTTAAVVAARATHYVIDGYAGTQMGEESLDGGGRSKNISLL